MLNRRNESDVPYWPAGFLTKELNHRPQLLLLLQRQRLLIVSAIPLIIAIDIVEFIPVIPYYTL